MSVDARLTRSGCARTRDTERKDGVCWLLLLAPERDATRCHRWWIWWSRVASESISRASAERGVVLNLIKLYRTVNSGNTVPAARCA